MNPLDFYILDQATLRRSALIEGYTSFIWTDRFNTSGDFEIKIDSTPANRAKFTPGTFLGCNGSNRFMIIDTVEDAVDDNGADALDITGKSFENILNDRVAMNSLTAPMSSTAQQWIIGPDTPQNIINTIFQTICVECVLDPNDTIPFYTTGSITPAGNIAFPTDTITATLGIGDVYTAISTLCATYNLGFRFVKDGDTGQVYFELYTGNDRTSGQSALPSVIFSEDMDNLTNKSILTSTASVKTVAYVFAQNGTEVVYALGADTTATGLGRRVLFVDASDIDTAAGDDLTAQLTQKGLEALAAQQTVYTFDGQIPEYGGYIYGTDYELGDIVEEQDSTGFGNRMRVTEHIYVSDDVGDRSYPTLAVDDVVVPGTWSAWPANQSWSEVDETDVWGNV
jgi:hypothetical protein